MPRFRQRLASLLLLPALGVLTYQLLSWYGVVRATAALLSPAGRADLVVPPGFAANVFASGLSGPRFLEFGPDGRLYVAEIGSNRVAALEDKDGDGTAETTSVFASDLASPHSVTWHNGALYVGVPTGVVELRDTNGDGKADARKTLIDSYPTDGHSTRTVLFLPDGRMVVSIGSSCNVCDEADWRRAAIVVYDGPSAKGEKLFAKGLRNAVGLALRPGSAELWVTCHGRDWLGDDLPPETVNLVKEGSDFGWPRCHAGDIVDPEFGDVSACNGVAQPSLKLPAHSAPLALAFYTGTSFPQQYRGDLFVAYHGSWNRSVPTGYKVVRVHFSDGKPAGPPEDFATGFADIEKTQVSGRPVGLAAGPDGALYVSDDKGGFVYRIAYVEQPGHQR